MTYPGTKLTPFSERLEPKKQTRPHGFLDDAAQERARACLSEIRERWTELYPRPNNRDRGELHRLFDQERGYTVAEGNFIFDWYSRIGRKATGKQQ